MSFGLIALGLFVYLEFMGITLEAFSCCISPDQMLILLIVQPTRADLNTVPFEDIILSDTSLAALSTPDGSRQLLFQTKDSSFRRGLFVPSSNSWTIKNEPIELKKQPRLHTPIAILPTPSLFELFLIYVDTNDHIVIERVSPRCTAELNMLNEPVDVLPGSRRLSATLVASSKRSSTIVVLYEDASGSLAILHIQVDFDYVTKDVLGLSQNITHRLLSLLPQQREQMANSLSFPFTASSSMPVIFISQPNTTGDKEDFLLHAVTLSSPPPGNLLRQSGSGPAGFAIDGKPTLRMRDWLVSQSPLANMTTAESAAVEESDLAPCWACNGLGCEMMGPCYVRNQSLQLNIPGPDTVYPYSRLGFAQSNQTYAMYIYHQLDGHTLCEDVYNLFSGWSSRNITVTSSTS